MSNCLSNACKIRVRGVALRTASVSALVVSGILMTHGVAMAQAQATDTESVVVTGTHISNPDFTTPTPVTSVSSQDIQMQGTLQANQLEFSIPQLVPQVNFQTIGGSPGQSTLNLRGLGALRTLVLLNGRRVMPTSYDGTVDANIIPTSLIKRVDVVTGGASAAYGSDAVAGVVNFVLDDTYEGLKGQLEAGQSQYHDNNEYDAQITGGFSFDGDRGHVTASLEAYSNSGANGNINGTGGVARRGWANQSYALIPGGAGFPSQISRPNVTFSQMTPGGVIDSGPLKGIYFGPGGSLNSMVYGTNISTTYMVGGTGGQDQNFGSISPTLGRQDIFVHATYDLTDNLTVWGQVLMVHNTASSAVTPNYDNGTAANPNLVIKNDNPFIPTALRTLMTADNVTSFTIGRLDNELGLNTAIGHYFDVMYDLGLKGKLNNGWTWDLTGQYNSNSYYYAFANDRNNAKWALATDVTTNPAAGGVSGVAVGAPICRSALAGNTSCVPVNLFGVGSITPAMAAYVTGSNVNYDPQQSWDVAGNVQGNLLRDWAGDVSVAMGGEVRRDSIHGYADPTSIALQWRAGNTLPFSGHTQVEEGYIEADIPLLKDLPLAEQMGLSAAGRITNYSTSGLVETWKLGIDDQITGDLRGRLTYSSDIRAPTLNDLFAAPGTAVNQFFNNVTKSTQSLSTSTGGNSNLDPEQANTLTGGFVYAPSWLPGAQASVDYYQIHVHGGIQATTAQQLVDNCQLYHIAEACANITTNGAGNITNIFVTPLNVAKETQDGIDMELDYTFPGSSIWDGMDGNFNVRAIGTYTNSIVTTATSGATTNYVSQTLLLPSNQGVVPKWVGVINASYTTDLWTVELDWRYTGALRFSNTYVTGVDIDQNDIASRYYFNLSGEYEIFDGWRLYARVANLFNVSPPINPSNNLILPMSAQAQSYDRIGRDYSVGVRFNL